MMSDPEMVRILGECCKTGGGSSCPARTLAWSCPVPLSFGRRPGAAPTPAGPVFQESEAALEELGLRACRLAPGGPVSRMSITPASNYSCAGAGRRTRQANARLARGRGRWSLPLEPGPGEGTARSFGAKLRGESCAPGRGAPRGRWQGL